MTLCNRFVTALALAWSGILIATPALGEDKKASDEAAEMAKMVEMGQPSANHKVLEGLVGSWDCKVTFWMSPDAPPSISTGTAVRTSIMDGRYFLMNTTTKMQMPGADGKMELVDYKGMELDGYDNMKGKFFSTFIDNMGTGLLLAEGSKTFTYHLDEETGSKSKTKVRETVQIVDPDHHVLEWYEERGGREVKAMEITYTRQK
jgi:hypothetical protein